MSTINFSLTLLFLVWALLSGCTPGKSEKINQQTLQLRSELTSAYMYQYPEPIWVSTNGEMILTKVRDPDLFALQVYDIKSRDLKVIDIAYYTQLSLTWGNEDSYVLYQIFNPEKNAYALMKLNLTDSISQEIQVPRSYSALPPLRPSPEDSMLALVTVQNRSLLQVISFNHPSDLVTIDEVSVFSDVVWKNNEELVYSNLSQNAILKVDLLSVEKDTLYYNSGLKIKDLEIGPTGIVSFTASDHTSPWINGYILQGNEVEQIALSQNISKLLVLDSEYIVQTVLGGQYAVLILDHNKQVQKSLPHSTINRVTDSQLFLKVFDPNLPPRMLEYRSGQEFTILPKDLLPIQSEQRSLNIEGRLPTYLWKSKDPMGKCIIDVHGGPHLSDNPYWDAGRYFLGKKGYHILAPNYRGSSGYTQEYEQETSLMQQIEDLKRTVAYAMDSLQIAKENIYFIGRSYGGGIVQAFLNSESRHQYGGWIIMGGILDPRTPFPTNLKNPVQAYYGKWDRQAPPSLKYLDNQHTNKVVLTLFDQEGHHFHRTDSRMEIYRQLIIDN